MRGLSLQIKRITSDHDHAFVTMRHATENEFKILCTLLHGKPHTDKTLLVEALAHNYNGNFYPVSQSDVNQYGMRNVFEMAKEKLLETDSHSIIFSDGAERVIVNNCNHWEFSAFRTTVDSKHVEAKKLLVLLLHSQVHQLYWNTSEAVHGSPYIATHRSLTIKEGPTWGWP